jgi:FkbM family methyltransferase
LDWLLTIAKKYFCSHSIEQSSRPADLFTMINKVKQVVIALLHHRFVGYALVNLTEQAGLRKLSRFISHHSNYYPRKVFFDVGCRGGKTRRAWMYCADANDQTARSIWLFGFSHFEKPLPDLYARLIHGADCIINVGTNSGFYTLISVLVCPTARIDAFEPFPPAIRWLKANLELNNFSTSVNVFKMALGNTVGEAKLYVPGGDHGLLETSASLNPQFVAHHSDVLTVPLTTIDRHVDNVGVKKVNVIQLDVESQEHAVLEGASRTLGSLRPFIILELLPAGNCEALDAICSKFDYRSLQLTEDAIVLQPSVRYNPAGWNQLLCPQDKLDVLQAIANELKLHFRGE